MEQAELDRITKLPGRVKGTVFQSDASYIFRHFGQEGLLKVENKINEWGQSIKYDSVKAMEAYPAGLRVLSLLAVKEVFNLSDEQIFDMGVEGPKHSFIIKMLLKFFVSLEKIFKAAPLVWRRHWDIGEIELVEINEAGKRVVINLKGIDLDQVFCIYEAGYFAGILRLAKPGATATETECVFKGGKVHQYTLTW